jgi:hypothetical protein
VLVQQPSEGGSKVAAAAASVSRQAEARGPIDCEDGSKSNIGQFFNFSEFKKRKENENENDYEKY